MTKKHCRYFLLKLACICKIWLCMVIIMILIIIYNHKPQFIGYQKYAPYYYSQAYES